MKKIYMKPDAEYIALMSKDVLAADVDADDDVGMDTSRNEGGEWEEF